MKTDLTSPRILGGNDDPDLAEPRLEPLDQFGDQGAPSRRPVQLAMVESIDTSGTPKVKTEWVNSS